VRGETNMLSIVLNISAMSLNVRMEGTYLVIGVDQKYIPLNPY
jgi:hypothetical protein